jgi:restriction system protein
MTLALPSTTEVDLALLVELVRAGRSVKPRETYDGVASHFPDLTPEDRARTRKDGTTKAFDNMVNWARNRLRVRGLLDTAAPAGLWQPKPEMREALIGDLSIRGVDRAKAEAFVNSSQRLSDLLGQGWAKALRKQDADKEPDIPEAPPEPSPKRLDKTEPTESLGAKGIREELLRRLNAMSGGEFEQFIGRLLDSLGFRDTQVVGRSGDEGVDVISYLHSPFVTAKVAVQVKRHTANVGPRDISYLRDRWARRSDRLLFITTSDFTSGAREVADDTHEKQVQLVSGSQLVDVMIEHEFGVSIRPQVVYEVDETYFAS